MLRVRTKLRDVDKGFKDLTRRIMAPDNVTLKVGVFADSGTHPDGTSLVQVAIWNEFGTSTIPPRPFIRVYFSNETRVRALASAALKQVITHNLTKKQALERLGMKMSGEIQHAISVAYFGAYPANALETIRKKGSSTPLVDTGQLRSAISYRVDLLWETFE